MSEDHSNHSHSDSSDDNLYHGIGIFFLAVCPIIGASVYSFTNIKNFVPVLNGFAGGLLFG
jgi:hypothetical protein